MKEKIYTIPVTEAFNKDCECPLCLMEEKLEEDAVEYSIGASMMEPDSREKTNETGFCAKHFEKMYNLQKNRLSLALVIDTHLAQQNNLMTQIYEKSKKSIDKEMCLTVREIAKNKLKRKETSTQVFINNMINKLSSLENTCSICEKINFTMDRYIDVVLYLYFKEPDFRELFLTKKGFCLKHFKMLLEGANKYLNDNKKPYFIKSLMDMQLTNMQRVQEDVNYFTKKFDYRYENEPWKNSKDAVPRSIKKIVGPVNLK